MRALAYTRISLDRTGEGLGVERQEESIRLYCQSRRWEVVGVESDNSISAYAKDRPGWDRVLEAIRKREVDVVVVWRLDRLTRSARQLLDLIDLTKGTGVKIATVEGDLDLSGTSGRLVATILAAVAQAETEARTDRQRAAHAQRREQGRSWWTRRPWGMEKDGTPHETEAPLLQAAYRDVLDGHSINGIATRWREMGLTTTGGGTIRSTFVRQLLLSPRNAGIITREEKRLQPDGSEKMVTEEMGEGDWTPLVDLATFRATQALLNKPERRTTVNNRRSGLLTGVLVCGACNGPMGTKNQNRKGGKVYRYVACRKGHNQWPREWTERHIERLALFALSRDRVGAPRDEMEPDEVEALEAEDRRLRDLADRLPSFLVNGSMDDETFSRTQRDIATQRQDIAERLAVVGASDRLTKVQALTVDERRTHWDGLDTDGRRDLILDLFGHITAAPRGRTRSEPDPQLLTPEHGTFGQLLRQGIEEGASVDRDMLDSALASTPWRMRQGS